MSLTQIQRDAIARAKRGDFALLDAMELKHRIEIEGAICGYRIGGRLRLLAYGDDETMACEECEDGAVACQACKDGFVSCTTCADSDDHLVKHDTCKGAGCSDCDAGEIDCPDCDGTGDATCEACDGDAHVDCKACDGTGEVEVDTDLIEDLRVTNLDGREIWRADDPAGPPHPTEWAGAVGRNWADSVLAAYVREIAEAAAMATASAGQTTMTLEPA